MDSPPPLAACPAAAASDDTTAAFAAGAAAAAEALGSPSSLVELIIADPFGAVLVLLVILLTSLAAGYNGAELSLALRRSATASALASARTSIAADAAAADDAGGDGLEPAHPSHFVCSITAELM